MNNKTFRFGLRGATAGVLALALLAGWEIVRVLSGGGSGMSQSPANVWIFVGYDINDGVQENHLGDSLEPGFAQTFPLRLLLCEDDKDNRWVIRELLEMLGYRPNVVESGEDALDQLKNRAYDAVLMDVRLPGLSGMELTRAIRAGEVEVEDRRQYIIAVTAYAMNEDREKCLEAGMDDYIRKPVEIVELKEALKRAHQKSGRKTT